MSISSINILIISLSIVSLFLMYFIFRHFNKHLMCPANHKYVMAHISHYQDKTPHGVSKSSLIVQECAHCGNVRTLLHKGAGHWSKGSFKTLSPSKPLAVKKGKPTLTLVKK